MPAVCCCCLCLLQASSSSHQRLDILAPIIIPCHSRTPVHSLVCTTYIHTHRPTTMLRSSCTLGRRLLIRTTHQQQQQQRQRMSLRAASSLLHPPTPLAAASLPSSHAVPQQLQQHQYQQQYQYHQRRAFSSTPTPPAAESHEFQAETRQLLDIVIHSVYTDKEVCGGVLSLPPTAPRRHSVLLSIIPLLFLPFRLGFSPRAHLQCLRRARKAPAHPRYVLL